MANKSKFEKSNKEYAELAELLGEDIAHKQRREDRQRDLWREDRVFFYPIAGVIAVCVATILIGLSIAVPWLGIPVTVLAAIWLWLG